MSVQQLRPPVANDSPPWYRQHVAQTFRRVLAAIPGRAFTSSTDRYVAEFCKLNNLKR